MSGNKIIIKVFLVLFIWLSVTVSCKSTIFLLKKNKVEEIIEYDTLKFKSIVKNNNSFDTIERNELIKSNNRIFKKGRIFFYRSFFIFKNDTILIDTIKIIALGKRWFQQPNMQKTISISYSQKKSDSTKISKIIDNACQPWIDYTEEGIIENEHQFWIHPIRNNQYIMCEIAPFPCVEYPLKINHEWERNLSIFDGYGKWNGYKLISKYQILKKNKKVKLNNEKLKCWEIIATNNLGNKVRYFFNEEIGFFSILYEFNNQVNIYLELFQVN
ncbi:MAG: hypothetical protein HYR91_01930 [Flavobacteriia bacterium]|nr:hypothetical protein [Flavobacteriia bacterium]